MDATLFIALALLLMGLFLGLLATNFLGKLEALQQFEENRKRTAAFNERGTELATELRSFATQFEGEEFEKFIASNTAENLISMNQTIQQIFNAAEALKKTQQNKLQERFRSMGLTLEQPKDANKKGNNQQNQQSGSGGSNAQNSNSSNSNQDANRLIGQLAGRLKIKFTRTLEELKKEGIQNPEGFAALSNSGRQEIEDRIRERLESENN